MKSGSPMLGLASGWRDAKPEDGVEWLSWCNKRAGNDGRRPSGVQWQRTGYNHAVKGDDTRTLCKREVLCLVEPESRRPSLPRCRVCLKRAGG